MFIPRRRLSSLLLVLYGLARPDLAMAGTPYYPPIGIDNAAHDASTRPQDDFYQYVNGAWMKRTVIPADQVSVTPGREVLNRVEGRLRALLEEAAALPGSATTLEGKIGAMYAAFMDQSRIDALGATPLRDDLAAITAARDKTELATLMGRSQYDFGGSIYAVGIDVDLGDPTRYAVYVGQAGLGLPDRDYYLDNGFRSTRTAYRDYIERLLVLVGWREPATAASAILALETRIAQASWSKAAQRDLRKLYNPMSPTELGKLAPGFDWAAYLAGARIGSVERLVVAEYSAVPKLAAIYADTPLDTLKAWQAFMVADSAAPYLARDFDEARYRFRRKTLAGQSEPQPRWKRAIAAVSGGDCIVDTRNCFGTLNWAVGEVYAAREFTPQTKTKAQQVVADLVRAFHARIEQLDWMSAPTRNAALRKLDTYTVKIGYPDRPRDYAAVDIRRDDLVGDVRRAARADWDFYVIRSNGPVDRTDWAMTPQTVDAYNGLLRDIVFPAAYLQPPLYDPAADDAVNYGSMGATVGHELTHGFDDEGRVMDAAGALRDWWTEADSATFKARATALGQQFAAFEPLPGQHINPDLTMGENIADLGGLLIALDAYHASLRGKPAPVIGGLTGDQRFFIAYAQNWRGVVTEDAIRQQTASDPHSYRKFRVQGPLPNIDAWYEAFKVHAGDKMYLAPGDRVRIW